MRYQEKVIVKDGKRKVVIKNRCNRNRNADDLCDLGFFEWFASPEWTSWKLFWNHLLTGSALSGKERYVFVGIHRGSFWVWVGAAWCCSFPFLWVHAWPWPNPQILPWSLSLWQGWWFCACWCLSALVSARTPARSQSCSLQSCFEKRGKRNREKEMIDSSPLDFCC